MQESDTKIVVLHIRCLALIAVFHYCIRCFALVALFQYSLPCRGRFLLWSVALHWDSFGRFLPWWWGIGRDVLQ